MRPTVRVRMGAPHWDITVFGDSPVLPPALPIFKKGIAAYIDLRSLDKEAQRKAIFEVVKFQRLRRDHLLHNRG